MSQQMTQPASAVDAIRAEATAAWAFFRRNLHLIKRYWGWEVVFFVYTAANSVTMGFIGKGFSAFGSAGQNSESLILFMLIGSILWAYLSVLFEIVADTVEWERWEGTIEYTFMAPAHRATHLLSTCGFSVAYGLARSLLLLVAISAFFSIDLGRADLLAAGVVLTVASISFIGFGMMASVLPLISPEKGADVVHIFQAVLLLFSGVYYQVTVLPGWMQSVARVSPATYALRGMRAAILDGAPLSSMGAELLPLLLMGVIMLPLGLFIFGRFERHALKTGRLKRSG